MVNIFSPFLLRSVPGPYWLTELPTVLSFQGRGSSWKMQLLLGVHLWLGLPRAPKPMVLIRRGVLICTWLSDLLYIEGFCWVQEILQQPALSGWSRSTNSQLWVFHRSESFPLKQHISEATPLVRSRRKYSKGGVHERHWEPKDVHVPCNVWSS